MDRATLVLLLLILLVICVVALLFVYRLLRVVTDSTTTSQVLTIHELPRKLSNAIELHNGDYLAAGFRFISDLKTSRRGVASVARFYLSEDNRTMAEIASHQLFGFQTGKVVSALTSLLADGTVLQSVHYEKLPDTFGELTSESKMMLVAAGSTDPRTMRRCHNEQLSRLHEAGRTTLPIRPDFIPELNEYIYYLADWQLHREGALPEPPEMK